MKELTSEFKDAVTCSEGCARRFAGLPVPPAEKPVDAEQEDGEDE